MPRRRPPKGPSAGGRDLPPLKIIRKILLLQLAFYATASVLIAFTTTVYGTPFSANLVLNWDSVRGDTTIGWILGFVWLLNSFIWYTSSFPCGSSRSTILYTRMERKLTGTGMTV